MSIHKLLRSSILPVAVIALGLGFTLPASGAVSSFGPAPGGEGCTLVFETPNVFSCVGPCASGDECSREALIIQKMDGSQILSCGLDCPLSDCQIRWEVSSTGLLSIKCLNHSCSACLLDLATKVCDCTG